MGLHQNVNRIFVLVSYSSLNVCFNKAFLKSKLVIFDLFTNLLLLTNARNYLVDLFRYQEIEWRFSFSFKSEDVLKNVQKVDILKRFWRHGSLKNYERMNYNSKFIIRIEKWKKAVWFHLAKNVLTAEVIHKKWLRVCLEQSPLFDMEQIEKLKIPLNNYITFNFISCIILKWFIFFAETGFIYFFPTT